MLTIVFVIFIGVCAVAGVFISTMAKKRKNGTAERTQAARGDVAKIGRATGGDD